MNLLRTTLPKDSSMPGMIMKNLAEPMSLFFLTFAMTLGQYSIFMFYHQGNFHDLISVSENLLNGYTHWRVYQNRVMGPALIKLFQMASCKTTAVCDYGFALKIYHFLMMCLCNFLFCFLASRLLDRTLANGSPPSHPAPTL